MALNLVQQVRLLVQDNTPGLYVISDEEVEYLLERNNNSVTRASLEAARIILFNLSTRTDDTVDIFSIKSSKSAASYMQALQLFLRDPQMNPVLQNCQGYVSGVSKSDMQANNLNLDNNVVTTGNSPMYPLGQTPTANPNYFSF